MTLGEEIRAWRRRHGLNLHEAALILGVAGRPGPQTVGNWEKGGRPGKSIRQDRVRARMAAYVPPEISD